MTRIAKTRPYRSELREQQADGTRARILDAAVRVMAGGVTGVSVPAVAREAGVSVPTVYRHFATKTDLFAALYPHLMRRVGLHEMSFPTSLDDLRRGVHESFERIDRIASLDELAVLAMTNPSSDDARRATYPRRLELARGLADTVKPRLSRADRDRIARLIVVLTSSGAFRVWREFLGASVDEAADDVAWVIRSAITGAGTRRNDR
ncbi:MAG TPA: helix-turn-helix domain-containing protein [Candidatus Limnocylindria bacterium]|nr:helix-turn-helix domain-containing protein [Candidatus Limnocylindria bacterium]